jgi:hypothetical protein
MFLSIPFAFYSMGPVALIIATCVILLYLAFYDYGEEYLFGDDSDYEL